MPASTGAELVAEKNGSHYRAVTGYVEDGPEAVGGAALALLLIALTLAVAAWLWWVLRS